MAWRHDGDELQQAMNRLRTAERDRRAAIEELIRLGAVRSHVLVGDLGEPRSPPATTGPS